MDIPLYYALNEHNLQVFDIDYCPSRNNDLNFLAKKTLYPSLLWGTSFAMVYMNLLKLSQYHCKRLTTQSPISDHTHHITKFDKKEGLSSRTDQNIL